MKILVTGDRGFVGSATKRLLEKEPNTSNDPPAHTVIGYDLMSGQDIRDGNQLEQYIQAENPDRILHLAAIARFSDADKDPKLAFETNVMGTRNVVAVAKKYHVPLVYSSTGSVYMPIQQEDKILTENSRGLGNSVYGCTKYAGETYVREHNPYIILRYAHLYGKEKRMHGLIGGFMDRINRGLAPTLYGGKQSNDFTYIEDVARANVCALTAPWDAWNQVYNIGTGEELSAEEAGKLICEATGYTGEIEKKEMRTVDPMRFWFSCEKAEKMLGFKAEWSFKEGLNEMLKT